MDDLKTVNILAKLLFDKQVKAAKEIVELYPNILTNDFHPRLQAIMYIKKRIVAGRWRNFIDKCFKEMFSSCEMYLRFVFHACSSEQICHKNLFESFLSVCAVLDFLSEETLKKIGINFCNLNPDIFNAFYHAELQYQFIRQGGCQRFLEFIRDHRYLKREPIKGFSTSPGEHNDLNDNEMNERIKEELRKDCIVVEETNPQEIADDLFCNEMAAAVLKSTSVKLPNLPEFQELFKRLTDFKKKEMIKNAESKATEAAEKSEDLQGCSSLVSKSKTNPVANDQENSEHYENIIQAVIKHNQSKNSGHDKAKTRIQEKADGILNHLNGTIKSLMEVLNEYDKE